MSRDVHVGLLHQTMPAFDEVDAHKVGRSQCDATCDEEDEDLTEEEFDLDGEQDDEGSDHSTDASSTYSRQDSDIDDDTAICASPEAQELVQQMPELSDNYQILGKIGEGIRTLPIAAYHARNLQLGLQSDRPQLPALCEHLGS